MKNQKHIVAQTAMRIYSALHPTISKNTPKASSARYSPSFNAFFVSKWLTSRSVNVAAMSNPANTTTKSATAIQDFCLSVSFISILLCRLGQF